MSSTTNNFRGWVNNDRPRPMNPYQSRRAQEEQYWRQRDDAKKRADEQARRTEEERVRKATDVSSEMVFPSLGGPRPKATALGKNQFAVLSNDSNAPTKMSGTVFAKLATEWKKEDDATRDKERLRRAQSERERFSNEGIFVYRRRESAVYEEPEEEEQPRSKTDCGGWSEISRKTIKPKKEMSADEMDAIYGIGENSDDDVENDEGRNSHLFEVSHRHDHR